MGPRFRGRFSHSLDAKGRLSIPVRFREILKARSVSTLFVTNAVDHLVVYPSDEWERVEEKVLDGSIIPHSHAEGFMRYFIASAAEVSPDSHGRILLPAHLREEAGLDREVVVLGALNYFEIWNPERLETWCQQARENFNAYRDYVAGRQ